MAEWGGIVTCCNLLMMWGFIEECTYSVSGLLQYVVIGPGAVADSPYHQLF